MVYLDDRILRILKLRQSGKNETEIGEALALPPQFITSYESSLKDVLTEGIRAEQTRGKIAASAGVSLTTLNLFAAFYGISFPPLEEKKTRRYQPLEETIAELRQLVGNGITSLEELSTRTGLSPSTVKVYCSRGQIALPKLRERRIAEIQQLIAQGVASFDELCIRMNVLPQSIFSYCKKIDVPFELPSSANTVYSPHTRRRPEIDSFIECGETLPMIGSKVGLSHERIRQYINATGQYGVWRTKREEKKQGPFLLQEERRKIVASLKQYLLRRAQREGFIQEKALQYLLGGSRRRTSYQSLVQLLTAYESAQKEGKKLSLQQLSKKCGIFFTQIGEILRHLGLEPMYGTKQRIVIPQIKTEAIRRSIDLSLSSGDVSYFLDIPLYAVQRLWRRMGYSQKEHLSQKDIPTRTTRFTYALASQIYEAQDEGFVESLGIDQHIVHRALEARPTLEKTIIHALQTLYPEETITKPYLEHHS